MYRSRSVSLALLVSLLLSSGVLSMTRRVTKAGSVSVTIENSAVASSSTSSGGSVGLTASIAANVDLPNAVVDYYVIDASGHIVTQLIDNPVSFSANNAQTINQSWTVPASQASGSYTFKVGVFTQSWGSLVGWDDRAGSISVAPVHATIGGTSVSAGTVSPGGSVGFTASIAANADLPNAVVDYYVMDASGHIVTQLIDNPVSFSANNAQTINQSWTVPASQASGSYTFKVGVFTQSWGSLVGWDDRAGSISVGTSASVPTQVPATQVPATQVPATQVPATQVPATQVPAVVPTATPQSPPPVGSGQGFISSAGTNLTMNGSVVRVTGYNYSWLGTNCSDPSTAEIDAAFADIQKESRGAIVRTAFYQSGSNNGSFSDFDRYVAAAKTYGLHIVPMLVNEWHDCEPSSGMKYLPWYQTGYTRAGDGYPLSFHDYAVRLAAHYANEPTIAWWQLANEPDARNADNSCSESTAAGALRSFADTMTGAIKAVDPHHMVDLGAISWCGGQGGDYQMVNAGATNLCDAYHDYGNPSTAMPADLQNHLSACHADGKPAFVGESGICADVTAFGSCGGTVNATSLAQRASFFKAKMDAAFAAGAAGYLIWQKGVTSSGWDVGVGDPTQGILAGYTL